MIETKIHFSPVEPDSYMMMTKFTMDKLEPMLVEGVFREVVRQIAEKFVSENFGKIAAAIDPQAIANMAVAESGAVISSQLKDLNGTVRSAAYDASRSFRRR